MNIFAIGFVLLIMVGVSLSGTRLNELAPEQTSPSYSIVRFESPQIRERGSLSPDPLEEDANPVARWLGLANSVAEASKLPEAASIAAYLSSVVRQAPLPTPLLNIRLDGGLVDMFGATAAPIGMRIASQGSERTVKYYPASSELTATRSYGATYDGWLLLMEGFIVTEQVLKGRAIDRVESLEFGGRLLTQLDQPLYSSALSNMQDELRAKTESVGGDVASILSQWVQWPEYDGRMDLLFGPNISYTEVQRRTRYMWALALCDYCDTKLDPERARIEKVKIVNQL